MVAAVGVRFLEIVDDALFNSRFHLRLVQLRGCQRELQRDARLHAAKQSRIQPSLTFWRIEELHGQRSLPARDQEMIEVDFGLSDGLLAEFQLLHFGLWLPHCLPHLGPVCTLIIEPRVIGIAEIFIFTVVELEFEDFFGSLGVLGQVLVQALSNRTVKELEKFRTESRENKLSDWQQVNLNTKRNNLLFHGSLLVLEVLQPMEMPLQLRSDFSFTWRRGCRPRSRCLYNWRPCPLFIRCRHFPDSIK